MKKTFVLFLTAMLCGLAALCFLPGQLLKAAEQVTFMEEIISGDKSAAAGVTVTAHYDYDRHLFWDTVYTVGTPSDHAKAPDAAGMLSSDAKAPDAAGMLSSDAKALDAAGMLSGDAKALDAAGTPSGNTEAKYTFYSLSYRQTRETFWTEQRGYDCLEWNSELYNWSASTSGSFDLNENVANIPQELLPAYRKLAEQTQPGESKSMRIRLKDYFEYYPIEINVEHLCSGAQIVYYMTGEEQARAYSDYFRIPVSTEEWYQITLEKDKTGAIVSVGGSQEESMFQWEVASICTDTDIYFIVSPYSNGKKIDFSQVPGGFGVYRQPYSADENNCAVIHTEELEMVYALTDDFFVGGTLLLDINRAGQLVIFSDTKEGSTAFLALDLQTWELVQKGEFSNPAAGGSLLTLAWATDEFLLLSYEKNSFVLLTYQPAQGLCYQFAFQAPEDSTLSNFNWRLCCSMDWNGKELVAVSYERSYYGQSFNCNFELEVYDATGQLYHGRYVCSLQTEQEYSPIAWELWNGNNWEESCWPNAVLSIRVKW